MQEEREIREGLLEESVVFLDCMEQFEHAEQARKSERKWLLLKNLRDVVLILNREGTILFIYPTLPGFTIEDTIGKTVYDFMPTNQHKKIRKAINEVFRTGEVVSFETSVFGPDGSMLRWSTRLNPVKNHNKIISIAQISINITKCKQAEEKLPESEQIYCSLIDDVLDSLEIGILILDDSFKVVWVNEALERYFGLRREDLIGKDERQLIRKQIKDIFEKPETFVEKVLTTYDNNTYIENFKCRVLADDQRKDRLLQYWSQPIRSGPFVGGRIEHYTDITERKKTEEHLRIMGAAIASSINAIVITDVEGNLTYVNNSFLEMWGHENDKQILGKSIVKFCQTEEKASKVIDILRNGGSWIGELTAKRKDSSVFDVQLSASPVIDDNGELICMMGSFVDITEKKRLEQVICQSEEKYRTLVESTGETIATINEEGVFLFINRIGAERFGGKPKDYIGKTMWDLFPKKIADRQAADVRKVINTGKERNVVALTELQGQLRWYNTSIVPLRDCDEKVTTVIVIARDIHEFEQVEEELNKYREKISQVEQLASVGTLSATLAHELSQPLTVIRLSIQNSLAELETMSCPSTVVEDLKKGLSEISSVTSIIDRFRNFARVSSERTVKIVDLREIAEKVVELLDESAWRAKVTLQVKGMDKLPPIYSHEKEMQQLFYSLVENAIQAANGKKSRQVIISGVARNEHIELKFSDNCGGIAPETLERIFEPFFTTKNASERTGLGLCVVKRIISRLNGKVRVESKLGKGSTFFVTLPIKGEGR
jgi:PAS domain S-box-containing protein